MLLIGDVHINSIFCEQIIENIRNYVYENNDEKNIIFMWDFVYHFSYDRKSLLKMFNLFLEFFKAWKNIYVLAGNHDRISDNFVFLEWQSSFDIINSQFENKIYFITKAFLTDIEGQKTLFFPYNYFIEEKIDFFENPNDKIQITLNTLSKSDNKYEKISANINNILYKYLSKNNDLLVFHHYYFADQVFTGQKSKFSYKDVAISSEFLSAYPNARFISWHLHQAFLYKNYFCTGSMWNTSFLEQNQFKFLYKYFPKENKIIAKNININPYIFIEKNDDLIDENYLKNYIHKIFEQNISNFESDNFDFCNEEFIIPDMKKIVLTIFTQDFNYDDINLVINKDLVNSLKDIKIKRQKININSVIDMAQDLQKDLQNSVLWWKSLLQNYLQKKYWNESQEYEKKLKDLNII